MTFVEHRGGEKQMLNSSKENEEQSNEAPLQNHQRELLLSKPTTKTHQWLKTNGKNILPTLSIYRIFGVLKNAL